MIYSATGSIIGTLPIPGDPSKDGDIELTLVSEHSPVGIQESTKNLILKQPLDKEGISGLSSVLLDVACSKKETDDPVSFVFNFNFLSEEYIFSLEFDFLNITEIKILS